MAYNLSNWWAKQRFSYLYGYDRRRVLRVVKTFFAIIGGCWTIIEFSSWLFDGNELPSQIRSYILAHLKVLLFLVGLSSIFLNRKKVKIQKTFSNTDLTIIVEFCDIFSQEGAIIIPVSDTFDNDLTNGLVNPKTLHGQFLSKYYPNNIPVLNNEIVHSLNNNGILSIETNNNLKGNKNRYEIGSACSVKTQNKYFYLGALTYMRDTGNVDMQPQYIYDFLSKMWNHILIHGEYHDVVNIPVIGTGLNRLPANYTNQFIVIEIINSFFTAAKTQTFCKTLRICLHPKNYKLYDFDGIEVMYCHIDNYLNR